jgi:hypothetical protein
MIKTRKNEFLGFGKKQSDSTKDLKTILRGIDKQLFINRVKLPIDVKDTGKGLSIYSKIELYSKDKKDNITVVSQYMLNINDGQFTLKETRNTTPRSHHAFEWKKVLSGDASSPSNVIKEVNTFIKKDIASIISEFSKEGFKSYSAWESLRKIGLDSFFNEAEKEDSGVIRKVGNKWRILKKNRKDYWDAEYDTKADAQAALRAYWANKKGESTMRNIRSLRNRKFEKKRMNEMAGGFDKKSHDGMIISVMYTGHDIELLLGGGNWGYFRVPAKIEDKESLQKAFDKVVKKAGMYMEPDMTAAAQKELDKHKRNIKESSEKKESLKSLRHGDFMLSYDGDDIDWDEFEEDVFHCFKIRNADNLVLKYADEACSDEEMEEEILAKGDDALEEFYDSCVIRLQDEDNGDIAIFLYDADEITNFDYKLCLE